MFPFYILLTFILAFIGVIVSIIATIKRRKNPSLKLSWTLIPLFISAVSLIINFLGSWDSSEHNKKDMENLKTRANKFESRGDSLKIELDSISNKLLKTGKELSETKEKLAPRTITKEQKEKFIAFLKDKPKGNLSISYINGVDESLQYAKKLEKLLSSAGYKVKFLNRTTRIELGVVVGVWMRINSIDTQPKFSKDLYDAFRSIGINIKLWLWKGVKPFELNIRVGQKE
jgi:hypothetical protein